MGNDCTRVLSQTHEVTSLDFEELDITDPRMVDEAIRHLRPDAVINCAGYTRVDDAEQDREAAWKLNAEGVCPELYATSWHKIRKEGCLARVLDTLGGRLVHISTDYVFDGARNAPEPYLEHDRPHPLSYYGMTSKLEGENAVLAKERISDTTLVVRTSWLYGITGRNFVKTMLSLALRDPGRPLRVVNDQFGSPTWTYRLALQIDRLLALDARGIHHASAEGFCSWYDLALAIFRLMEIPHAVTPCTTEQYPTPAARPRNSILENGRLKEHGINVMRHWEPDIEEFITRHRRRLLDEARDG